MTLRRGLDKYLAKNNGYCAWVNMVIFISSWNLRSYYNTRKVRIRTAVLQLSSPALKSKNNWIQSAIFSHC